MDTEFMKLDKNRNPKDMDNEALWYDDAILHYRYLKAKLEGQKYEGWSLEDFVNYHVRILQELKRKGLKHFDRDDDLDKDSKPFLKEYAPVHSSGAKLGERIFLEEIISHFKQFKLRKPYVYLVGGIVVNGSTEGDVDILVKDSVNLPPEFRHILEWRILRSFPSKYWNRFQFHYDNFHGPFTDFVELYDLTFERINYGNQIIRMDNEIKEDDFFKQEVRTTDPKIKQQAQESIDEDRIKLFRFFIPLKSAFSPLMAYRLAEKYSVEQVIEHLKAIAERRKLETEIPAVVVQKKYDGIRHQIHKSKDKVLILTDDGSDDTERMPQVVGELKAIEHPESFILDCEVELWKGRKHEPREMISGYIHEKGEADDSGIVVNVFDMLYCYDTEIKVEGLDITKGDLHKLPQEDRLKHLNIIKFKQSEIGVPDLKIKLNLAPTDYCRTVGELTNSLRKFAEAEFSEGAMVKLLDSPYPLNGITTEVVKYKKYVDAHVKVWRVNKTETEGVWNYDFAVGFTSEDNVDPETLVEIAGKKYSKAGRSYNTDVKAKIGDVITIRFHTVNLYRDPETGEIRIHLYEPIFHELRVEQEEPDQISAIIQIGKEAELLEEKIAKLEETEEKLSYVKPAFGSPGGKSAIVKTLLRYLPEHKIYVEAMVGGGALFFNKDVEDGKTEVINDINPEIIFVYKFLKRITEEDIKKLKQFKSVGEKEYFERLINKKPTNDIERLHKFIYLSHFSFGGSRRSFSPGKAHLDLQYVYARILKIKERLKGVKIHNEDYLEVLKQYDSSNTFFYLDPPYPGTSWPDSFGEIDLDKMSKKLKALKGKFLLSLNDKLTHRNLFKDFEIRGLTSAQYITFDGARRKELLIANYPLKSKSIQKDFEDIDLEKANYIGNKRRFAEYIVKKFPTEGKTVFDPMCGCSAVLIEAVRKGYRVIGNDLSIIPYWYSKGVFEGTHLTEDDIEKIINAKPQDGWLTTEWKGMYPRKREIRKYIDGLVLATRNFTGKKLHTARAIVSRLLQTLYSDSGSGYSTRNWETITDVKRILNHSIKEVNGLVKEVSDKGKITSSDARKTPFPKSDIVYFDPPFFRRDKGHVKYFDSYRVTNSILLQKEWRAENLKKEEVPDIIKRLCNSTKCIFVSSARNCQVPWAAEISKYKRTIKKYRLSYHQTSGFPAGRDEYQLENLLIGKSLEKQVDHYMRLPSEDETYQYVCQHHFRGKSVHTDFRIESLEKESLIGWTINNLIEGSIKEPITTLEQAKELKYSEYSKIDWNTGEFAKRKKRGAEKLVDVELVCERKAVEPHAWLDIEGVTNPGTVGATKQYPGVFYIVDKGDCEYGVQKPWVHEYFPKSDQKKGGFNYRIFFRQLRVEAIQGRSDDEIKESALEFLNESSYSIFNEDWDLKLGEILKAKEIVVPAAETKFREEAAWLLIKPLDQTPYVLSDRAVEEKWVSPKGFSALPKEVRNKIPKEFKYWMMEEEKDRLAMRDVLANAIKEEKVKIQFEKSEEIEKLSLSDAQFVLQYHYFRKRGEKPVREGPTIWHYDLRIDIGKDILMHWVLDHDITEANQTVGYYKEDKDKRALTAEGFFPPGTFMNSTKDTSAFVEIVDKGKCNLMINDRDFKKVEFKGKSLRGVWILDKKNDNWLVERSQASPVTESKGEKECRQLTLSAI